jgi:hypothetical protein
MATRCPCQRDRTIRPSDEQSVTDRSIGDGFAGFRRSAVEGRPACRTVSQSRVATPATRFVATWSPPRGGESSRSGRQCGSTDGPAARRLLRWEQSAAASWPRDATMRRMGLVTRSLRGPLLHDCPCTDGDEPNPGLLEPDPFDSRPDSPAGESARPGNGSRPRPTPPTSCGPPRGFHEGGRDEPLLAMVPAPSFCGTRDSRPAPRGCPPSEAGSAAFEGVP